MNGTFACRCSKRDGCCLSRQDKTNLSSYSQGLNPDELLNADFRQRVTKAAPARTKMALTRTAVDALGSIQKQPGRVERYFVQKDVCYAA